MWMIAVALQRATSVELLEAFSVRTSAPWTDFWMGADKDFEMD
jgi:hypothetical protein